MGGNNHIKHKWDNSADHVRTWYEVSLKAEQIEKYSIDIIIFGIIKEKVGVEENHKTHKFATRHVGDETIEVTSGPLRSGYI